LYALCSLIKRWLKWIQFVVCWQGISVRTSAALLCVRSLHCIIYVERLLNICVPHEAIW
jgi:hypothetical protein